MPKANIHPKLNKLVLIFPDGEKFETESTSSIGELHLDVDFRKHPAWTGSNSKQVNEKATQVAKFNKRFAGITSFGVTNNSEETSEDNK